MLITRKTDTSRVAGTRNRRTTWSWLQTFSRLYRYPPRDLVAWLRSLRLAGALPIEARTTLQLDRGRERKLGEFCGAELATGTGSLRRYQRKTSGMKKRYARDLGMCVTVPCARYDKQSPHAHVRSRLPGFFFFVYRPFFNSLCKHLDIPRWRK